MILKQTFRDLELIISDDHSTDHTPGVASALAAEDSRVRYHRPALKGGINMVLNEGIQMSRGTYVHICHDHDIYCPPLTERLVGVFERNPSVVFVHPGRHGCDYLGNPLPQAYFVCGYSEVTPGLEWRRLMLSRLDSPVTALTMIRRDALEKVGLFDAKFGACSDIDMWLKLCAVGDVGYVNELLLYVRGREPGHPYDGRGSWHMTDQVIRAHEKHLRIAYQGWRYRYWRSRRMAQIDLSLLFIYLNCLRHRRWQELESGRQYLRGRGIFFSKVAAWLS